MSGRHIWLHVCILLSLSWIHSGVSGTNTSPTPPTSFHHLPGVSDEVFRKAGDINIGALVIVYKNGVPYGERCSRSVRTSSRPALSSEAIAWAVDKINEDPTILPNVSLGYIMRGVCASRNVGLATSLSFLPRAENTCNNGSSCYTSPVTSSPNSNKTEGSWHDVIGVIGPGYSSISQSISYLYAVAHMPLLGVEESSDDFSYKRDHPYFFRVGPPDRYIVEGILKFISDNGWSYISVVYADGSYGLNAFRTLEQKIESYGICIATSALVLYGTNYDLVIQKLLAYPRARVVVLFLTGTRFRFLLTSAKKVNATGHFIWIGGDSVASYTGFDDVIGEDEPAVGAFVFDHFTVHINSFYEHFGRQNPRTSPNPWLKTPFEYMLQCSYADNTCTPDADVFQTERFLAQKSAPMRVDAVKTFAQAAHNLLSETCPDAHGQDARNCFDRKLFHEYLKNVTLDGYNGHIQFDENLEVRNRYVISQFVYDYYDYPFTNKTQWKQTTKKNIGTYDTVSGSISYFGDPIISWSHLDIYERVVPWVVEDGFSISMDVPESVCSRPCLVGEYKIEKEVTCCWECRRCRDNERLVDGNSSCQSCPLFTWPDPASAFTTCGDIPPTYQKLDDTIPIIVNSLASAFLLTAVVVSAAYIRYRDERVIKATSKELSGFQLVAILSGYVTAILFQTTPTDVMCGAIFFLFCMSFSLLYCPLVVKTVRIYRIFRSGAKNQRPRFISPHSQFAFSATLVLFQAILCAGHFVLQTPRARLSQPVWSEKYVELSCDLTMTGMTSFLGYNLVLVAVCSVLAFMVRKLPDNFNESKFISMCVSTTLLIWLAFIPTYFTASREYIRTFLLCMALILNHTVALMLLFVPKVYAAIFVVPPSDTSGKVSNIIM